MNPAEGIPHRGVVYYRMSKFGILMDMLFLFDIISISHEDTTSAFFMNAEFRKKCLSRLVILRSA